MARLGMAVLVVVVVAADMFLSCIMIFRNGFACLLSVVVHMFECVDIAFLYALIAMLVLRLYIFYVSVPVGKCCYSGA